MFKFAHTREYRHEERKKKCGITVVVSIVLSENGISSVSYCVIHQHKKIEFFLWNFILCLSIDLFDRLLMSIFRTFKSV